jgi:hypothetical protein
VVSYRPVEPARLRQRSRHPWLVARRHRPNGALAHRRIRRAPGVCPAGRLHRSAIPGVHARPDAALAGRPERASRQPHQTRPLVVRSRGLGRPSGNARSSGGASAAVEAQRAVVDRSALLARSHWACRPGSRHRARGPPACSHRRAPCGARACLATLVVAAATTKQAVAATAAVSRPTDTTISTRPGAPRGRLAGSEPARRRGGQDTP